MYSCLFTSAEMVYAPDANFALADFLFGRLIVFFLTAELNISP